MIAHSLADVQDGGILLLEGGISGLCQNVYTVALQVFRDRPPRILYLRLAGNLVGQNEVLLNETLLANSDVIPDISHGANYASVPFSDKQLLLQTIYDLVGRRIPSK